MIIKFGEWISVRKALPPEDKEAILFLRCTEENTLQRPEVVWFDTDAARLDLWRQFHCNERNIRAKDKIIISQPRSIIDGFELTHWMPLPSMPEEI